MTNRDLVQDIYQSLQQLSNLQKTTFKFDYWSARNMERVKSIFNPMEKALIVKEHNEFVQKVQELNVKSSAKDENGQPKIVNNAYVFSDPNKRQEEYDLLSKKYKSAIDAKLKKETEYNDWLDNESDFKPFLLNVSEWMLNKEKVDGLTSHLFFSLMPLISIPENFDLDGLDSSNENKKGAKLKKV